MMTISNTISSIKLLSLLFVISTVFVTADRTVRRVNYKLSGDIISLTGDGIVHFELVFIDATALTSTLEIEAEQWIHDRGLQISSPPHLQISSQKITNPYSHITAYLRLRKPLSKIILAGATTLTTTNALITDTLLLTLSGSSNAHVIVEINSELHITVSGAADLSIRGSVKGTGYISVSGSGDVRALSCPMNIVIVDVAGVGDAYVTGIQAVHATTSGLGTVHRERPLRDKLRGAFSWFKSLFGFRDIASKAANKPTNNFLMLFFVIVCFYFNC